MPVVREFTLPDLGEGLTEALIVRWLVDVGEVVVVDQLVVEVETAKAMVEVPCPYGGVVTARFGEEGTELPVGAPLLTVAVPSVGGTSGGAAAPDTGSVGGTGTGSESGAGASAAAGTGADEGSGNVLVGYGTGAPAARRRRVRPVGGVGGPGGGSRTGGGPVRGPEVAVGGPAVSGPVRGPEAPAGGAVVSGAGGDGAVWDQGARPGRGHVEARAAGAVGGAGAAEHAAPGTAPEAPVAVISPLVRRLAREHGLDLREVTGSGPDGLILRADVERAVRAGADVTAPRPGAGVAVGEGLGVPVGGVVGTGPAAVGVGTGTRSVGVSAGTGTGAMGAGGPTGLPARVERIPLRGLRGAVADKLSRSRTEIPDATCWVDADATELLAARSAMNAAGGPTISLLALLARICTAGLARFPELNATVDTEAREIVRLPAVHLGFAAQTDRGLVVPVVRDAHTRSAEGLGAEMARLTEAARAGRITPAELTGGTFTLNNYGVFGVDGSTPIINHPEAAMLGVGRIVPKPWVHEGELAIRKVVQLSFTFDHRVCDGGTAGGFLRYVADCVEHPAVLLRSV
ncbi:dihydrolipoamide acetyltransferase family protein [Streptomyces sp. P1-3]|uniref:dihydrolipoamide acetyltransferase family protein n=1 Tax=Streptomyces sp. P1-3 TaxID=3421658 RepID=UPI003D359FF9